MMRALSRLLEGGWRGPWGASGKLGGGCRVMDDLMAW